MPTLISSQFKGPSNTNDGTMVTVMENEMETETNTEERGVYHDLMTEAEYHAEIEAEVERRVETEIQNFKSNLAGGDTETAMVTGDHDSRSTDFTNLLTSKTQYHYAVRRITPTEGERLQGFADGWTRPCFTPDQITDELVDRFVAIHQNWAAINGKPDAKPKSRKWVRDWLTKISSADCPDGPRYKAIGNSMSTNVMRWIGQRIQQTINQAQGE